MSSNQSNAAPGDQQANPYASATRWRHQESTAFARYAAEHPNTPLPAPREPVTDGSTGPLADFLNSNRVEPHPNGEAAANGGNHVPLIPGEGDAVVDQQVKEKPTGDEVVCGPLLNYRGMRDRTWYGSALVVVKGGGKTPPAAPTLVMRRVGPVDAHAFIAMSGPDATPAPNPAENPASNGTAQANPTVTADTVQDTNGEPTGVQGTCLYSDPRYTFWQFSIDVAMEHTEVKWEYAIPHMRYTSHEKPQLNSFFVPSLAESMRTMFFSCNGFSLGTDEEAWSGLALWNDVLRRHKEAPFHVMIGGGDQIYNDGIRVNGPLRAWTDISNPAKRHKHPFPETLRRDCDNYYLENYIKWYNTEPFASANGQIPQLNIWDDHDIIDGFGSYVDHFMKCDVFRGIGGTAHKYYMLFQHHLPPPASTYTTDSVGTTLGGDLKQGFDPTQVVDTYVAPQDLNKIGYILGPKPGPYVAEHSVNLYARLGARVAFLGIDARTERTRHQINYPETYKLLFEKLTAELVAAKEAGEPIAHLMILLGVPIAYPRLTWLENIFSSPLMGPIKFLNRRFGVGGSFFNKFDGSVDLLDDLDDHWTARTHKKERRYLIRALQDIGSAHDLRITILSGDVHLAAVGRFYSNTKLRVPAKMDKRYMPNVISSAIVNKPPPQAVANLLAHRNKIHHLSQRTDETLLAFFDESPGGERKAAKKNHFTMPSRNYAMLTENSPTNAPARDSELPEAEQDRHTGETVKAGRPHKKDGLFALHEGERGAGTKHKAASKLHGKGGDGSLDICIRVEINQHDKEGKTQGYGLTVPVLKYVRPTSSSSSSSSSASGLASSRAHSTRTT